MKVNSQLKEGTENDSTENPNVLSPDMPEDSTHIRGNISEQVNIATLGPKVLTAVESWTEKAANFTEEDWKDENFELIHQEDNPRNLLWIGKVEHIAINEEPKLVATFFTQKIKQNTPESPTKNSIFFIISPVPITKADLVENYDDSTAKEEIAFGLEFDYDGPGRHSLKHRFIAEKFRSQGLGTEILKKYEALIQKMAEKEKQSNIIHTNVPSTMKWATKNGYIPDTPQDEQKWQTMQSQNMSPRVYIKFRKDFIPQAKSSPPTNHT